MTEGAHRALEGLSARAFAERLHVRVPLVLRWCREGRIIGARKHPLSRQWWIYPPAKLVLSVFRG